MGLRGLGTFLRLGASDLLFHNVDTGAYSVSVISNDALVGTYQIGSPSDDFVFKSIGDYNGDGRSDILFENVVTGDYWAWLMNGLTIATAVDYGAAGSQWSVLASAPAGRPELPALGFFVDASGQVHEWKLSGALGGATTTLGPGASGDTLLATGDFFGDRQPDLLFENASGVLTLWRTEYGGLSSVATIGAPGSALQFKGLGDFNGDGRSDLLFQDAQGDDFVWNMDGANVKAQVNLGNPGAGWTTLARRISTAAAAAKFFSATPAASTWSSRSPDDALIAGGGVLGSPGAGETYLGEGDFTATAKRASCLKRQRRLRHLDVSGSTLIGGGVIGTPAPNLVFKGIADLTGDHLDSIVFYNTSSSQYVAWEINDTTVVAVATLGSPGAA